MYIKDTLKASISGNAGTATKLANARNITIGNKSNNFDGSGSISFSISDIGASPSGHTHNQIDSRGAVTCETGANVRPAVDGLSMTQVYNNGYPTTYGNVISLKGSGDGQILVGWPGVSGEHAPVYVRSRRDTTDADWSSWAQVYTTASKPTPADIGALPLTGGTLSGRLYADGKISVKARGGSWIDTVNFDNVAIANNTEPHSGAYFPLLAARTEGGHTISLGSNYTGFGFYGFKNGRTENGVDLQFSFDVNAHTTYTNTWMKIDNGMEVAHDLNASLFRPRYAPGSQNCYIGGGNGDNASYDEHNMIIRSHWGIGFHDYENVCRTVLDTRTGNLSTHGSVWAGNLYGSYIQSYGEMSCGGRLWAGSITVNDKFVGETKFSLDGAWIDPWEGVGCAIKAHGHIATIYTVKAGYLNAPQQELNGWPGGSQAFLRVDTNHDGNGQGDGNTHLGYNNGDGYHHFFRGTGAMHVNMHQGLQVSNDFIYMAGIPLTISGNPPSRGGVWIQI